MHLLNLRRRWCCKELLRIVWEIPFGMCKYEYFTMYTPSQDVGLPVSNMHLFGICMSKPPRPCLESLSKDGSCINKCTSSAQVMQTAPPLCLYVVGVILVEPLVQYIWDGFISPVTRVERYHLSDTLHKIRISI